MRIREQQLTLDVRIWRSDNTPRLFEACRANHLLVHFLSACVFFFARMQQHMHACVDPYVPTGLEAGPGVGGGGGILTAF